MRKRNLRRKKLVKVLIVPTWLFKSELHGYGCFSYERIPSGALVWVFNPEVDQVLAIAHTERERLHAYGSNAQHGRLVLPGDNAAWINFDNPANLVEAEEIGSEFCLRAARDIEPCQELTVPISSDTDAAWKMRFLEPPCTKEEDN